MPRLLKEGQERKITITCAIEPKTLDAVDKNIQTLRSWLCSKFGISKKEAEKEITRSYFIRECLSLFSRPECVEIIKNAAALYLGLNTAQTSLFDEEKKGL